MAGLEPRRFVLGPEVRDGDLVLRPWREDDREALVRHADDRRVWRNLTDRFPHPYTLEAADAWIELQRKAARSGAVHDLAIEVDGESAGGIGMVPFADLARAGAEVGYWLGQRLWGRGIATRALVAFTRHVFAHTCLERLQATVIEWNPASARVLEKAGYALEGRLRRSITKDGRVVDSLLYARLRDDP